MYYAVDLHGWPGLDECERARLVADFRERLERKLVGPAIVYALLLAHVRVTEATHGAGSLCDLDAAAFYQAAHLQAELSVFGGLNTPRSARFEVRPAH